MIAAAGAEHPSRLQQSIQANRQAKPTDIQADGLIIRVNKATKEAYINLTKKDPVVPGITFRIYSPKSTAKPGTTEDDLGSGSLEVVEVGDKSTLCRITRTTPGHEIKADDLLSNLIFHTNLIHKFHLVLVGDFDLDGEGVATPAERDKVAALVVKWGGQVDEQVTPQTDCILAWVRTRHLCRSPESESKILTDKRDSQDRYDNTIVDAKRLALPVFSLNRFLA